MEDRERYELEDLAREMGLKHMSDVVRYLITEKRRELNLTRNDANTPVTYAGGGVGDLGRMAGLPEPGQPERRQREEEEDDSGPMIDPESILGRVAAIARGE